MGCRGFAGFRGLGGVGGGGGGSKFWGFGVLVSTGQDWSEGGGVGV